MAIQRHLAGLLAAAALSTLSAAADAAFIDSEFEVRAVNVTGVDSSQSEASASNFNDFFTISGISDTFNYDGLLDFRVGGGNNGLKISQWLATGNGVVTNLDPALGDLQQSSGNINNGTAITTFYWFTSLVDLVATTLELKHDDGVWVFDDGVSLGGVLGPTSERTTTITGFDGGKLGILYAATNGNPSVLEVSAVPVPAAAWLLGTVLVAAGAVTRRRNRCAV